MAEQQQQHPFDPRVSRKDPFPSFETAMAAAGGDDDDAPASGLDWSIDTIAELKPSAFSPLPEQKAADGRDVDVDASEFTPTTAARRAQFFEDEAQYKVLETPSPLLRQQQQQQQQQGGALSTPPPPLLSPAGVFDAAAACRVSRLLPGASAASDLHSRCQDAIAFFGDRLRERQRKISRLQLPQQQQQRHRTPPPRAKSAAKRLRDSEFPWRTPSASELKGIHPRASGSESRGRRPGSAPSSEARASRRGPPPATPVRKPWTAFSFGDDSPISPIAPPDTASALLSPIPRCADATPSFESPPSFSDGDDRDKENGRKRHAAGASVPPDAADARALSSSRTLSSSPGASWGKAGESPLSHPTLTTQQQSASAQQRHARSIAQRQESFVAAIEAEASSPPA